MADVAEIMTWLNFVLVLGVIGVVIYLGVKLHTIDRNWSQTTNEIKSKIGALIRQINNILEAEYNIDVAQQADINRLKLNSL
jgi:sensor domain CHASE-containing protein